MGNERTDDEQLEEEEKVVVGAVVTADGVKEISVPKSQLPSPEKQAADKTVILRNMRKQGRELFGG